MPRLLITCLLLWSCGYAAASEPSSPVPAARYVAKVNFLKVDGGKQVIAMNTEVAGTRGTPVKIDLGGKAMRLYLKLEMQDMANTQPTQYVIQLTLIEVAKDGKENVLAAPKITTLAGQPAKLMVGQEKGDRIEVDLVVSEGVSAANEPKPAAQHPTNKVQPPVAAQSSYGESLMMIHPRTIIQDEEEEKLPVAR